MEEGENLKFYADERKFTSDSHKYGTSIKSEPQAYRCVLLRFSILSPAS
jgi:hypothetical protein